MSELWATWQEIKRECRDLTPRERVARMVYALENTAMAVCDLEREAWALEWADELIRAFHDP